MVKRYLLTGLVAGFLSISSTLYAGESEIILKDNTTASGLTIKEETANTTIASFRGNGNVGIGTIAPTQKLEVVGNTATSGDFTFLGAGNHGLLDSTAGAYYISKNSTLLQVGAAGVFTSGIELFPGSGNSVRILNNGKVGIGTTAPLEKLHVAGGSVRVNSGDDGILYLGNNTRNAAVTTNSSGLQFHHFSASPTDIMTLTSGGKVGIGTTNPQSHLHIDNSLDGTVDAVSNLSLLVRYNTIGAGKGPGIGFSSDNTPTVGAKIVHIRTSSNSMGDLAFYTKSTTGASLTEKMRIKDGGNVGIGTTAPTERLEVLGNIKASGAVTQGSSREIKKNISYISTQEAMEALEGLNPVRFKYKADASGEEHLGFIAENVPELVAEQDREHLNPMDLTAVFAKVIQEQQKMLRTQKEAMDVMKHEIDMLKSAMNYGVKGL